MAARRATRVVALGSSILDVPTLRGCSLGSTRIEVTDDAMQRVAVGREVVSEHGWLRWCEINVESRCFAVEPTMCVRVRRVRARAVVGAPLHSASQRGTTCSSLTLDFAIHTHACRWTAS